MKINQLLLILLILLSGIFSCNRSKKPEPYSKYVLNEDLKKYRSQLDLFRKEFGGTYTMPDFSFYLFGMGNRDKYLYKKGKLINCETGKTEYDWTFQSEMIVPNAYAVYGVTDKKEEIIIYEDEKGIWLFSDNGNDKINERDCIINILEFKDHRYSEVLKVLHQEILINIIDSKPVPNYFVYKKPWRRDAAMMAMCLELTGNKDLIKDWVLKIQDPYDKNNGVMQGRPEEEADNLGQTLYLLSLFTDRNHEAIKNVLEEIPKWQVEDHKSKYIRGRSDFQEVPVYQTKWLIYGLNQLDIDHGFSIPLIPDRYSSLFWWDYKDYHISGEEWTDEKYPYIGWARDHFYSEKNGLISNRDYPLTWETEASQADYEGMRIISSDFVDKKIAAPHTWHAAEVFLYLYEFK